MSAEMREMHCQPKTPNVMTPAARRTDPETSHAAEQYINESGLRCNQQRAVLELIRSHPNHTTQELAALGLLGRDEISRRAPELVTAGLVEKGLARRCTRTGRSAQPWMAVGSRGWRWRD